MVVGFYCQTKDCMYPLGSLEWLLGIGCVFFFFFFLMHGLGKKKLKQMQTQI